MRTIIRILTFPVWFPLKMLWVFSKLFAFVFLVSIVALVLYLILQHP